MTTKIEWVKNPDGSQGYTCNFVVGCSAEGCAVGDKCYARRIAKRQKNRCQKCYDFTPHYHPERLKRLSMVKRSLGVFNSMGEVFDNDLNDDGTTLDILADIKESCQHHRFYLLTKQAQNLGDYHFDRLPNVWLGVSVNRQKDVWRIDELRKTDAAVKFVSFEPLYEYVRPKSLSGIDWVIIGAESCNGKITNDKR